MGPGLLHRALTISSVAHALSGASYGVAEHVLHSSPPGSTADIPCSCFPGIHDRGACLTALRWRSGVTCKYNTLRRCWEVRGCCERGPRLAKIVRFCLAKIASSKSAGSCRHLSSVPCSCRSAAGAGMPLEGDVTLADRWCEQGLPHLRQPLNGRFSEHLSCIIRPDVNYGPLRWRVPLW